MQLIYVAGKYRSETKEGKQKNIRKARNAAIKLSSLGWAVFTPHLNTIDFDFEIPDFDWLTRDLLILNRCDCLFLLNGWEDSTGANFEYEFAKHNKIKIYYEKNGYPKSE